MTLTIRLAEEADSAAILALLRSAFPRMEFREEWWAWFAAGPTRSHMLFEGERAIGLFSLVEFPARGGKRTALAANLSLAPEFQRRNRGGSHSFFADLAQEVAGREQASGLDEIYVVPNPNSAGRLASLGWEEAAQLVTWEKAPAAAARAGDFRPGAVNENFANLLETKVDHPRRIARTAEFLNWRLVERPFAEYEFLQDGGGNAAILKHYRDPATDARRLHLMDYGCGTEAGFQAILETAETKADGVDGLNFWLVEGDTLAAVAGERGFQAVSQRPLLVRALTRAAGRSTGQIAFTFADCDVY